MLPTGNPLGGPADISSTPLSEEEEVQAFPSEHVDEVQSQISSVLSNPAFQRALMEQRLLRRPNYETIREKYEKRLSSLYAPKKPRSIYELASSISSGILDQPASASPYRGMAVGFNEFAAKVRSDDEAFRKERQAVALEAAKMAMQDERRAEERIDKYIAERLAKDFASKEVKTLTLLMNEIGPDSQPVLDDSGRPVRVRRTFDLVTQGGQINAILSNPDLYNAIDVDDLADPVPAVEDPMSRVISTALGAKYETVAEDGRNAQTVLSQVQNAKRLAGSLGKDGFGLGQSLSMPLRSFLASLFPWIGIDRDKLSKQEALASVTLGFTLSNVAQTKGAISNKEMSLFERASPNLSQTYEGFLRTLEIQEKIALKRQEYANAYRAEFNRAALEMQRKTGAASPYGLEDHMIAWTENWATSGKWNFLSEDDIKALEKAEADAEGLGLSRAQRNSYGSADGQRNRELQERRKQYLKGLAAELPSARTPEPTGDPSAERMESAADADTVQRNIDNMPPGPEKDRRQKMLDELTGAKEPDNVDIR